MQVIWDCNIKRGLLYDHTETFEAIIYLYTFEVAIRVDSNFSYAYHKSDSDSFEVNKENSPKTVASIDFFCDFLGELQVPGRDVAKINQKAELKALSKS